jgi:hypothetical protein
MHANISTVITEQLENNGNIGILSGRNGTYNKFMAPVCCLQVFVYPSLRAATNAADRLAFGIMREQTAR